jgi:hypothetical protein
MKTPEVKLAEAIATATENHYFNSSIIAHTLADQPHYTIDRIMEMIVKTIRYQAQRHQNDWENGRTSEGLFLANELNESIKRITEKYTFNNLSLPKDTPLERGLKENQSQSNNSWLHRTWQGETAHVNVQAVL